MKQWKIEITFGHPWKPRKLKKLHFKFLNRLEEESDLETILELWTRPFDLSFCLIWGFFDVFL